MDYIAGVIGLYLQL